MYGTCGRLALLGGQRAEVRKPEVWYNREEFLGWAAGLIPAADKLKAPAEITVLLADIEVPITC